MAQAWYESIKIFHLLGIRLAVERLTVPAMFLLIQRFGL
jgi:hypothetical protein